jgi:DNA-binding FadR family transcriptional regulator
LHELRRSLEMQERELDDPAVIAEEDYLFHDAIIRATGNQVLYDLNRALSPLLTRISHRGG